MTDRNENNFSDRVMQKIFEYENARDSTYKHLLFAASCVAVTMQMFFPLVAH